jgi:hypothetical protein
MPSPCSVDSPCAGIAHWVMIIAAFAGPKRDGANGKE